MEEFEIALRPSRGRLVPDLSGLRRGTCVDFAS